MPFFDKRLEWHIDGGFSDMQTQDAILCLCSRLGNGGGWHRKCKTVGGNKTLTAWIGERFEYLRIVFRRQPVRCRNRHRHRFGIQQPSSHHAHPPFRRVRLIDHHAVGTIGMVRRGGWFVFAARYEKQQGEQNQNASSMSLFHAVERETKERVPVKSEPWSSVFVLLLIGMVPAA